MLTISLFMLLLWRNVIKFAVGLKNIWEKTWRFFVSLLWTLVYAILYSRIIIIFVIVGLVLIYKNQEQLINPDIFYSCDAGSVHISVISPKYMAPKEITNLQVLIQNTSLDKPLSNLRIGLLSDENLWFPEGNFLQIESLDVLSVYMGKVNMTAPTTMSFLDKKINIHLFVQEDGGRPIYCNDILLLDVSKFRNWYIIGQSIPNVADSTIKIIGYITTFLAAILALSGQWRNVLTQIKEWTIKSDNK